MTRYKLELIPGFFALSEPDFIHTATPPPSFGLLDDSPDRWTRFKQRIEELQNEGSKVKVVFLGRHGEGRHNATSKRFGHQAWIQTYGRLDSLDGISLIDPELTSFGEQQALGVGAIYKAEAEQGMPTPTSFYTSPLSRSARTLELTFCHSSALKQHPPLVVEDLREGLNILVERDYLPWLDEIDGFVHFTDNKRSTKTKIARRFPGFLFEDGFAETDERWTSTKAETTAEHAARTREVLERIFDEDEATYIAVSAHGGTCITAMHLFGLPLALPPSCAVMPLVVRAKPL